MYIFYNVVVKKMPLQTALKATGNDIDKVNAVRRKERGTSSTQTGSIYFRG